ncbi:MAG: PD40 domain-containing protein [Chloroflexi bacterium]|nr:PD40 domain-containing protein [Chloroflexota bacterium]
MAWKRIVICLLVALITVPLWPGESAAQTGSALPVPPGRILAGDDNGLFTMLADGSSKTYVAREEQPDCWLRDGVWSPDGAQVMYTSICGGAAATDWRPDPARTELRPRQVGVFVVTLLDGSTEELVPPDGTHQDYGGAWLPDGEQVILYSDRDPSGTFNLYLFDLASAELTQLTTFDSDVSRVSLDPTGRYVLYNRRIAQADVVRMEVRALDLTNQQEISVAPGVTPAWSPDGKWITYATDTAEADIFIMPADCILQGSGCSPETNARNMTYTRDISERQPVFSSDQTQIVFVRDADSDPASLTWDILRQDIRTGLQQNLTSTPGSEERHNAWEQTNSVTPVAVESVLPVVARVRTSEGAANLRTEPSTTGAIKDTIPNGQIVIVQGMTDNGSWYLITLPADGAEAWIFSNLLVAEQGDLAGVPTAE